MIKYQNYTIRGFFLNPFDYFEYKRNGDTWNEFDKNELVIKFKTKHIMTDEKYYYYINSITLNPSLTIEFEKVSIEDKSKRTIGVLNYKNLLALQDQLDNKKTKSKVFWPIIIASYNVILTLVDLFESEKTFDLEGIYNFKLDLED